MWLVHFRQIVPETWSRPFLGAKLHYPAQDTVTGLPRYRVSFLGSSCIGKVYTDADPKSMSNAQISPDGPRCYIKVPRSPEGKKKTLEQLDPVSQTSTQPYQVSLRARSNKTFLYWEPASKLYTANNHPTTSAINPRPLSSDFPAYPTYHKLRIPLRNPLRNPHTQHARPPSLAIASLPWSATLPSPSSSAEVEQSHT